jgi:hypothetical protein
VFPVAPPGGPPERARQGHAIWVQECCSNRTATPVTAVIKLATAEISSAAWCTLVASWALIAVLSGVLGCAWHCNAELVRLDLVSDKGVLLLAMRRRRAVRGDADVLLACLGA